MKTNNVKDERLQRIFEAWLQYKDKCECVTALDFASTVSTYCWFYEKDNEGKAGLCICHVVFYNHITDEHFNELIKTFIGLLNNKEMEQRTYD